MVYTITYVAGIVRVTGTDPGTDDLFGKIFDASVAGAWGFHIQEKNNMKFSDPGTFLGIIQGDTAQVTVTTISSQNERVKIDGYLISEGAASFNTTFTYGAYTNGAGQGKAHDGSIIEFDSSGSARNIVGLNCNGNFYETKLIDLNDTLTGFYNMFIGSTIFIDCILVGGTAWRNQNAGTSIIRTRHYDGYFGVSSEASNQVWSKIRIMDCAYGIGALADGEVEDVEIYNSSIAHVASTFNYTEFSLLNCPLIDISDVGWVFGGGTTDIIKKFRIDAKCVDQDGVGIQGVTIEMYPVFENYLPPLGTPSFSQITDVNGDITQQKLPTYKNEYDDIITDYNDYVVIVKVPGFKTKKFEQTIDENKNYIFTMADKGILMGK